MTKNETRKIKKGIDLLELLIKELSESKSFEPIFKRRNTFYHVFYNGEKLDDLFIFLFPIDMIEDISNILSSIRTAAGIGPGFISGPNGGIRIDCPTLIVKLKAINGYLKDAIAANSFKVFYSWQSDLPNSVNRNFIENALTKAISNTQKETQVPLALDKDTSDRAGSPDIVQTILDKINDCFLFVADVSITMTDDGNKKKSPNANVLFELGYAKGILNDENVLMIFNSAFGKIEDLPFDLRGKRIMQYYCAENSNQESKHKNKDDLTKQLQRAIQLRCKNELQ